MEDSSLLVLGFLSIFHVIGAVAMASGFRGIWLSLKGEGGSIGQSLFFVLWGSMFGCMPFAITIGNPEIPLYVFYGQALIWGMTFIFTLFFRGSFADWAKPLFNIHTGLMGFGGIFMLAGLGSGYGILKTGDLIMAVGFGLIFLLVGFGIFMWGLIGLIRSGS